MILFFLLLPCIYSLNNFFFLNTTYLSFCNRLINKNGQVGCSSRSEGSYGILRILLNISDVLEFKLEPILDDQIVLLNYQLYTDKSVMDYFKANPKIAGIIVTNDEDKRDEFFISENSKCPNSFNSLYPTQCSEDYVHNATSYIFQDFPFPIVHLRGDKRHHLAELRKCHEEFNINPQDDTRCSVEISNFMMGIGNSEICIRRTIANNRNILIDDYDSYCQEIAISSTFIHGKDNYNGKKRGEKSTLLVITRVDARSLFEMSGFAQNGISVGSSILLSVVKNYFDNEIIKNGSDQLPYDVTFGFIDAEEFDYLGSINLAFDIQNGQLALNTKAPLTFSSISAVIEIGLVANPAQKKYFMMTDGDTYRSRKEDIEKLQKELIDIAGKNNLLFEASKKEMLPTLSSIQPLLQKQRNIDHILITDSDGMFKDSSFDSIFDDNIDQLRVNGTFLNNIADSLLTFILRKVTNDPKYEPPKITKHQPIEFLECFQNDVVCTLFTKLMPKMELSRLQSLMQPISMQQYSQKLPLVDFVGSELISRIMIYLTGKVYKPADNNCPTLTNKGPYYYHSISTSAGTVCYQTNIELHKQSHSSTIKPLWIRSNVKDKFVRYYRSTSNFLDLITVILGLILTLAVVICLIIFRLYIRLEDNQEDQGNEQNSSIPPTSETSCQ